LLCPDVLFLKKKVIMRKLIPLLIFGLLLSGCRPTYEEAIPFTNDEWKNFEKVKYQAVIQHTGDYDVSIRVYFTDEMQQEFFAMNLQMITPFGEERALDKSIKVLEKGAFRAEKNKDGYYELLIPFFKEVDFKDAGLYEFEAHNNMPSYKIIGIHELELVISPA
jgi:hypothetical protein